MEFLQLGRRIYYDTRTGNVLYDSGEMTGYGFLKPTRAQDMQAIKILRDYDPTYVGFLELEFGQFKQDFENCIGYTINVHTKQPIFVYSDGTEIPVSTKKPSLSQEIEELKKQNAAMLLTLVANDLI